MSCCKKSKDTEQMLCRNIHTLCVEVHVWNVGCHILLPVWIGVSFQLGSQWHNCKGDFSSSVSQHLHPHCFPGQVQTNVNLCWMPTSALCSPLWAPFILILLLKEQWAIYSPVEHTEEAKKMGISQCPGFVLKSSQETGCDAFLHTVSVLWICNFPRLPHDHRLLLHEKLFCGVS